MRGVVVVWPLGIGCCLNLIAPLFLLLEARAQALPPILYLAGFPAAEQTAQFGSAE